MSLLPSPDERIYCLLQSADAAPGLADGVAPEGMLCEEERELLASLRVAKRRRDWLLGRWTAKHLVRAYLSEKDTQVTLASIAILADPGGSPYATLRGARLPLSLSISHSGELSLCALSALPGVSVGADVEMIEPRPLSLARQFFTPDELEAVLARPEEQRDLSITLIWSAKEAFLKSVKEGLRVDTRSITVTLPHALPQDEDWQPLRVTAQPGLVREGAAYQCWWRNSHGAALTIGIVAPN